MGPTAVDLLIGARTLVERGWTQGADARAADGCEAEPWNGDAAAWSLLGALVASLDAESGDGHELPLVQLAIALQQVADLVDDDSLSAWNDEPTRTQEDVAAMLEAAADAAANGEYEPPDYSRN